MSEAAKPARSGQTGREIRDGNLVWVERGSAKAAIRLDISPDSLRPRARGAAVSAPRGEGVSIGRVRRSGLRQSRDRGSPTAIEHVARALLRNGKGDGRLSKPQRAPSTVQFPGFREFYREFTRCGLIPAASVGKRPMNLEVREQIPCSSEQRNFSATTAEQARPKST
jgi:hypothetical protein